MYKLLKEAINEVNSLKSGEVFLVRDLFKGYKWNRLPINDRRNLGRDFFRDSYNPHVKAGVIVPLDKSSRGQQKYKKV